MGGLGPKKFSTFGPSDASRKKTIKFHLMQAIAFYSPCFCLSNRAWHEQIVLCTIVTDPNNFKCHGTIFAIFWHQKTHYFLERTHQNLTHRMHDATHCLLAMCYGKTDLRELLNTKNETETFTYKQCNVMGHIARLGLLSWYTVMGLL